MNWYRTLKLAGLPAYTTSEFLHKLKMFGVVPKRNADGDHVIFVNVNNGLTDSIPISSGSKIINPITMKAIISRFNIPWVVFRKLSKRPNIKEMARYQDQLPWNQMPDSYPPIPEVPTWQKEPWYLEQQTRNILE